MAKTAQISSQTASSNWGTFWFCFPDRKQWILLSGNRSPPTALPSSVSRAADLCRPEPTREQSACISLRPPLSVSPPRAACMPPRQNKTLLFSQQNGAFYRWPLQAILAFAAKTHCRLLTWWMTPGSKPWAWYLVSHVRVRLMLPNLQGHRLSNEPSVYFWRRKGTGNILISLYSMSYLQTAEREGETLIWQSVATLLSAIQ